MPIRKSEVSPVDTVSDELADELMNRHVEVQTLADMMGADKQRGTPIPALQNTFYKFIQNPSTVSVETFKRMIDTDETIGSGIDFLVSCLIARLGAYQHEDEEIAAFVKRALSDMENGETDTYKEILSAAWAGFSVSEIVWANKSIGFVPERLASLPPTSLLFEAERTGQITDDGILQYQRNYNPAASSMAGYGMGAMMSSGFVPRPDPLAKFGDLPFPVRSASTFNYLSIRIPKLKCVHFAWNGQGRFGNPYGRAMMRRIYNWWVQKWAYAQMMGVALDRKGTPLMIGYADPNATIAKQSAYKSDGSKNARADSIRAPAAMAAAFANVHNDTFITLPGKKGGTFDVDNIEQSSNAADFISSIQLCNTLILRGLLIPALVFSSGDGAGSYALGETHARTFDKILDGYRGGFEKVLIDQLVKQLIAYNFPKAQWSKSGFGSFSKRSLTPEEKQKEAEMFEKAVNMGVVDVNDLADLNKMREAMGFEPRDTPIERPDPFGGAMEFDEDGNPVQSFGQDDETEGTSRQTGGGGKGGARSGFEQPGEPKQPAQPKQPGQAKQPAEDAGKAQPR